MSATSITRSHPRRSARVAALVLAVMWPVAVGGALADARTDLAGIESEVAAKFPTIKHLEPDALASLIASRQPIMIFDVREEAEYAVSHLNGAVRAAPGSDPATFVASLGTEPRGKSVVFYCSVGMRSSRLATTSAAFLIASGAASVNNLRGGIFRWSNEGRPLEKGSAPPAKASNSGITVHPYNAKWGRLIEEPVARQ